MLRTGILGALYALYYYWHNRPLARPLSHEEVAAHFRELEGRAEGLPNDARPLDKRTRARLRRFLEADDGRPFYMLNLMQYREWASYPDDTDADVQTGAEANALYSRAVLRELLKRGSYPVLLTRKLANFIHAGPGTDFFDEVAIVRYRSRRDLLEMSASDSFRRAEPHKWASLEQTVVVPTRRLLLVDPNTILPLLLALIWVLVGHKGGSDD